MNRYSTVALPAHMAERATADPREITKLRARDVLLPAFFGLLVFWALVPVLTVSDPWPGESMAAAIVAGGAGLAACLEILVRAGVIGRRLMIFGLSIYFARIAIGLIHYLILFDPTYFETHSPLFQFIQDFEALNNAASSIYAFWDTFGFGPLPADFFDTKNSYLYPYFAFLYYLGGNEHFLNFTVLNALHASLVAAVVARFAYGLKGPGIARVIFIIAMLQPFGFIASVQWRDSVGQFFLISGALLVILAPLSLRSAPSLVLGALSIMTLRNVYFVTAIIAFGSKLVSARRANVIGIVAGFTVASALLYILYAYSERVLVYDLSSDAFIYNMGAVKAAYHLIANLSGPFPWTQMFNLDAAGHEFMAEEVLQAIFNLTILYLLVRSWRTDAIQLGDPICRATLTFVAAVMAMGVFSYGHVTYMTVASVLVLPFIHSLSVKHFYRIFGMFLGIVLVAGLLWAVLGFSPSNTLDLPAG